MNFRGGEFSTGEMENFHPALTGSPNSGRSLVCYACRASKFGSTATVLRDSSQSGFAVLR